MCKQRYNEVLYQYYSRQSVSVLSRYSSAVSFRHEFRPSGCGSSRVELSHRRVVYLQRAIQHCLPLGRYRRWRAIFRKESYEHLLMTFFVE